MFKRLLQLYCIFVDKTVIWLGKGASVLVPILAGIVFFGTVARYVFNAPLIWPMMLLYFYLDMLLL